MKNHLENFDNNWFNRSRKFVVLFLFDSVKSRKGLSFQSLFPYNKGLHVVLSLLKSLLKKYTAHDHFHVNSL